LISSLKLSAICFSEKSLLDWEILVKKLLLIVWAVFSLSALVAGQQTPRVFITDSKSWEISGGGGGTSGGFGSAIRGGARPQTAEIIKTFGERCPNVTINNKIDKADYVVVLDHEGGKGIIRRDNKVAVFNSDGDSVVSHSTRSLGNAVQDACAAITKDWAAIGSKPRPKEPAAQASNSTAPTKAPELLGKISIVSTPAAADIEVDGDFVGNTPSTIQLTPGEHLITVKKSGFKDWQKKIKTTAGEINLSPELEKN
jgi:PEGA domain-containing protein